MTIPPPRLGMGSLAILAAAVAIGYGAAAFVGRTAALTWLIGVALGWTLQRTRFCFFCHFRDWFERRDSSGVRAILLALGVGLVGCHLVTSAWIPDAFGGSIPAKVHVAPVGWHLVLGGLVFGFGTGLSGSCISAHLYRLGEGAIVCFAALAGCVVGFLAAFWIWNPVWLHLVAGRPVIWLPAHFGFGGALVLQLAVLALLAWLACRFAPAVARSGPASAWSGSWPPWVGGALVGILASVALFRSEPLGVTSELSKLARSIGDALGIVPPRLEGMDAIRGCAARNSAGLVSNGLLLVLGIVTGSLASSLASGSFAFERPAPRDVILAAVGGVFLGIGALLAAGCTVGTLLGGIHASALSGWIFAAALLPGLVAGYFVRQQTRTAN